MLKINTLQVEDFVHIFIHLFNRIKEKRKHGHNCYSTSTYDYIHMNVWIYEHRRICLKKKIQEENSKYMCTYVCTCVIYGKKNYDYKLECKYMIAYIYIHMYVYIFMYINMYVCIFIKYVCNKILQRLDTVGTKKKHTN